jgi:hypothetical protein
MFANKIFASSLLLSNTLLIAKTTKLSPQPAECEDKSATEKAAKDLDTIFGAEGGMPPDPEEIQEMLMKA